MRWVKNDVDEIVCDLQSTSKKAPIVGFRPLRMRVGVAECGSGSRETYSFPRAREKVGLTVA
jgi:hypothetical protein